VARGGNILPVEKQISVITTGAMSNPEISSESFSLKATSQIPIASAMPIGFSLPKAGQATISIYSLHGAIIRTLISGMQSAGMHSTAWNGRDEKGIPVACGAYIVSLRQAHCALSQRITKF
jgi:flagellar hook assembly protein FlgD